MRSKLPVMLRCTGIVIDSFGDVVFQVVINGLSPVLDASGLPVHPVFSDAGWFVERSSRGASDGSANSRRSSTSTDPAKTHAGMPDGDVIRTRLFAHATSFAGTPSRACWSGGGIGSVADATPDAANVRMAGVKAAVF